MSSQSEDLQELVANAFAASGIGNLPEAALDRFEVYLELFQRWNARLNLSSIRDARQIIERHFIESALVTEHLPFSTETLMDFGSGGGFPGIPIAICRPQIRVTLAESQAKKASFLREAVRVTGTACEVFAGRVESMANDRMFDVVTMRAVEKMESAIPVAAVRARKCLVLLTTEKSAGAFRAAAPELQWKEPLIVPHSRQMCLLLGWREPKS